MYSQWSVISTTMFVRLILFGVQICFVDMSEISPSLIQMCFNHHGILIALPMGNYVLKSASKMNKYASILKPQNING